MFRFGDCTPLAHPLTFGDWIPRVYHHHHHNHNHHHHHHHHLAKRCSQDRETFWLGHHSSGRVNPGEYGDLMIFMLLFKESLSLHCFSILKWSNHEASISCLFVCVFVCLFDCLLACLLVCLFVCLFVWTGVLNIHVIVGLGISDQTSHDTFVYLYLYIVSIYIYVDTVDIIYIYIVCLDIHAISYMYM